MTQEVPQGTSPIDIDTALADPATYFAEPRDVLAHPGISDKYKLKLLQRWEQDARLRAAAEGEGVARGEDSMLGRVRQALRTLETKMSEAGRDEAEASIGATARSVGDKLGGAASQVQDVVSRTQERVSRFRGFMRGQPITGALLMFAVGYLVGRIAGGRR